MQRHPPNPRTITKRGTLLSRRYGGHFYRGLTSRFDAGCAGGLLSVSMTISRPGSAGPTEHLPVDPANSQFPSCRLNVTRQNIVVAHRCSLFHRLKHQVGRSIGLHGWIPPYGPAGLNHNLRRFESLDPFDDVLI